MIENRLTTVSDREHTDDNGCVPSWSTADGRGLSIICRSWRREHCIRGERTESEHVQAPVVSSRLEVLIIKCTKQACFQLAKKAEERNMFAIGLLLIDSTQIRFWVSRYPGVHICFTWERIVMSLLMVKYDYDYHMN